MERQLVASRKVQQEENKKKKLSVDEDEYCARKHVSDIESEKEEVDKSCLTEEEEDEYLSDHNSQKRTREAVTTRYDDTSYDDEWLFGTVNQQKKSAIKDDVEDMNMKFQITSTALFTFPRAQFLSRVGIFSLPYTVMF
ncbi:uncharacterized protein LOC111215896 [Brassica napus]|nr:uncharacterized protein LOC111215896 [Brassica napus]